MDELIKKIEAVVEEIAERRKKNTEPFLHASEGKLRAAVEDLKAAQGRESRLQPVSNPSPPQGERG